jgi:hypothetical protein
MVSISLMIRLGFGHLNFLLDTSPASFDMMRLTIFIFIPDDTIMTFAISMQINSRLSIH